MKRVLLLIALSGLVCASCNEDILATTDDPIENPEANDDDQDPEEGQGNFDDITLTDFSRTISITWKDGTASVEGDENGIVTVNGADVTVDNRNFDEFVRYELSGSSSDGSLKVYSLRRLALVLNSLDLTNAGGAAINVQTHKRTFVVLNGSSKLADGSVNASGDYPEQTGTEDMKAAFFSEAQLVFSGGGSLSVTAKGKAGITSDDYLRFMGTQTVNVTSANGHALRGKDGITVDDGTIIASASAAGKKGMSSDGAVTINGGDIRITVSGGVLKEEVTSGSTFTYEYTSSAGIKADSTFVMTGGALEITNTGDGGKGISGDMNARFEGGTVRVGVSGGNYGSSSSGGGPGGFPGSGGGRPGSGGGWDGNSSTTNDSSKSAKGIKFDGDIVISDGCIIVSSKSHEAIESKGKLTISGGEIYAYSASDDAINSAGDMTLSGGYICAWSAGNDGLDANGNLYIDGANVYAVSTKGSPEVAVDANTEQQKKLYLKSGTLVAIGGIESGSDITGTAYSGSSWSKGKWHAVYDKGGSAVFAFKAPESSGNSTMVVYCNGASVTMKSDVSNSDGEIIWGGSGYLPGSFSGGSNVSLSTYSSSGRR